MPTLTTMNGVESWCGEGKESLPSERLAFLRKAIYDNK